MKKWILSLLLFLTPLSAEVYDCFLFFNELDMLELRLKELYDHVDHFVLVESYETFKGHPKSLIFYQNKERFAPYLDKIIHVPLHRYPHKTKSAWDREGHQRNGVIHGLTEAAPDDIILLSDLDEIPKTDSIKEAIALLNQNPDQAICFRMKLYHYRINLYENDQWPGTMVTTFAKFREIGGDPLRYYDQKTYLPDAGWHFSSIGTRDNLALKYASYSHDYDPDEKIATWLSTFQVVPLDSTYPRTILHNLPHYTHLNWIMPEGER